MIRKTTFFILLTAASGAFASHEALRAKLAPLTGTFEAGVGYSSAPGSNSMQWLVDAIHLKQGWELGEKTRIVVHNAISIVSANNGVVGQRFNSTNYFSGLSLASSPLLLPGAAAGPTPGGIVFSNLAAYIQHEAFKNFFLSVGNLHTPLGMEGMSDRIDLPTYYYSMGSTIASTYGWNYDLGAKVQLVDTIPGSIELAVIDGRQGPAGGPATSTPALVARYHTEIKTTAMTITPVVSTLLGKFRGSPGDIAVTGGVMVNVGTLWFNAEAYYTSAQLPAGKTNVLSITAEPGVDLGVVDIGLKYNFVNVSQSPLGTGSGHNIAASVGKSFDKYRVRAVYQYAASTPLNPNIHDMRLLFSAHF